jgi:coenzyme F420-reducing hydrogenase delta subunit
LINQTSIYAYTLGQAFNKQFNILKDKQISNYYVDAHPLKDESFNHGLSDLYKLKNIRTKIQNSQIEECCEEIISKFSTSETESALFDMGFINEITYNPNKRFITVLCAGAYHTTRIATALQLKGLIHIYCNTKQIPDSVDTKLGLFQRNESIRNRFDGLEEYVLPFPEARINSIISHYEGRYAVKSKPLLLT